MPEATPEGQLDGAESAEDFARVPDGFQRLWTPHRMAYIGGADKPSDNTEKACPFCAAPARSDPEGLIVKRGDSAYVVLNLYPYNPGHVLVCPYRHVADYTEITIAERDEISELTSQAMSVIRAVSSPQGFNIGLNQGEAAGAGIAAHLHQHIVPRWSGDANFLPIIAQTKALPQVHGEVRSALAAAWASLD
ncbi:HIT domain-containing protein [Saxibacter everestensis]|uniref:HIT domain-containing protein n=1 Tax=Saxibacter everestensis TaxID=2909229 RepID=A0ABY8QY04_9MICO|nr:HIT domain-containing protein [Brevibacteriaceae bacterium ZFBP1038]